MASDCECESKQTSSESEQEETFDLDNMPSSGPVNELYDTAARVKDIGKRLDLNGGDVCDICSNGFKKDEYLRIFLPCEHLVHLECFEKAKTSVYEDADIEVSDMFKNCPCCGRDLGTGAWRYFTGSPSSSAGPSRVRARADIRPSLPSNDIDEIIERLSQMMAPPSSP